MRGRKCIKCGGKHGGPKYHSELIDHVDTGILLGTSREERLLYACQTCGYEISGPCIDSPEYIKKSPDKAPEPSDDGKVTDDRWPHLRFTPEERLKMKERYQEEDLPLLDGLELLEAFACNRAKRFNQYKSHYRTMIGWVLDSVRDRETKRMVQERNKNYLEGSKR